MKVPYLGLAVQHEYLRYEIMEAISRVLRHSIFILGDETEQFEKEFADFCGTKFALGVNSGTDALFLAMRSIGIGPGDEVITVANSFLATASTIVATGAKPVFVDVAGDMNIDVNLIDEEITENTRAIIPVHLTGRPAWMDKIKEIAEDNNLYVIEDAAQAIGAELSGKRVGSFGDVNCFSLHPLKNLNACGDGGVITTDEEEVYNKLLQLRNIGLKNRNESDVWGYNSRLDAIQAAILKVKFKYIDEWTKKRRANAYFYNDMLKDCVKVPGDIPDGKSVYHTYVIRTDRRDGLKEYLEVNGIETKIHYPIPIHLQKCAAELGYKKGDLPVTEAQVEQILSLPVYPELRREQVAYVAEKIIQFFTG